MKQQEEAFPGPRAVPPGTRNYRAHGFIAVITIEKLAVFSLGTFSAYQGRLSGPSASVTLSYLIFSLVPVSVFFRRGIPPGPFTE